MDDPAGADDVVRRIALSWLGWEPQSLRRKERLVVGLPGAIGDLVEVWTTPVCPEDVLAAAIDRGVAVSLPIGEFGRSAQDPPWDALTAYVLVRLAHDAAPLRGRRGRAFVKEERNVDSRGARRVSCYWSAEGVFQQGPAEATLETAVEWCRDRAREVLVQIGSSEYSAGDDPIDDLPPFEY